VGSCASGLMPPSWSDLALLVAALWLLGLL
jgi:hypothetical protein